MFFIITSFVKFIKKADNSSFIHFGIYLIGKFNIIGGNNIIRVPVVQMINSNSRQGINYCHPKKQITKIAMDHTIPFSPLKFHFKIYKKILLFLHFLFKITTYFYSVITFFYTVFIINLHKNRAIIIIFYPFSIFFSHHIISFIFFVSVIPIICV